MIIERKKVKTPTINVLLHESISLATERDPDNCGERNICVFPSLVSSKTCMGGEDTSRIKRRSPHKAPTTSSERESQTKVGWEV